MELLIPSPEFVPLYGVKHAAVHASCILHMWTKSPQDHSLSPLSWCLESTRLILQCQSSIPLSSLTFLPLASPSQSLLLSWLTSTHCPHGESFSDLVSTLTGCYLDHSLMLDLTASSLFLYAEARINLSITFKYNAYPDLASSYTYNFTCHRLTHLSVP